MCVMVNNMSKWVERLKILREKTKDIPIFGLNLWGNQLRDIQICGCEFLRYSSIYEDCISQEFVVISIKLKIVLREKLQTSAVSSLKNGARSPVPLYKERHNNIKWKPEIPRHISSP